MPGVRPANGRHAGWACRPCRACLAAGSLHLNTWKNPPSLFPVTTHTTLLSLSVFEGMHVPPPELREFERLLSLGSSLEGCVSQREVAFSVRDLRARASTPSTATCVLAPLARPKSRPRTPVSEPPRRRLGAICMPREHARQITQQAPDPSSPTSQARLHPGPGQGWARPGRLSLARHPGSEGALSGP
jgi:hypothetical protein